MDSTDRAILAFERQWFRQAGAKERAMREQLHLGSVAYYRRLVALCSDPEAIAVEPVMLASLARRMQVKTQRVA